MVTDRSVGEKHSQDQGRLKSICIIEKPTPTQVTTQDSYIPGTFCTLCRQLDTLEKFLPHGLVGQSPFPRPLFNCAFKLGKEWRSSTFHFSPRESAKFRSSNLYPEGSVSIPRELLYNIHSVVTFCLICLFVYFLRGSLLLSLGLLNQLTWLAKELCGNLWSWLP